VLKAIFSPTSAKCKVAQFFLGGTGGQANIMKIAEWAGRLCQMIEGFDAVIPFQWAD
jgi:hypothetical protein